MKQILVHDEKYYLARFLKPRLGNTFGVFKHTSGKFSKVDAFKNIDIIIIVLHKDFDIVHLIDYCNLNKPIIVASENIELLSKVSLCLEFVTVDLNLIKTDLFQDFETKITCLSKM